jgi:hypothetical protein
MKTMAEQNRRARRIGTLVRLRPTLLLALALTLNLGCAHVWQRDTNYVGENRYDFTVTTEEMTKSPVWGEQDENPPLSARRAMQIARKRLDELIPDAKDWKFEDLSMYEWKDGHWLDLIEFEDIGPPGETHYNGPSITMRIPVLMNGVAIQPKVTHLKQ